MGAVSKNNFKAKNNKKKNGVKQKFINKPWNGNQQPFVGQPFPPFPPSNTMRPRPPFRMPPNGRMPPPPRMPPMGMGMRPPPGMRGMPPPPLFRNRVPPPGPRMGPRGPGGPMPPMQMRHRPRPPLMGPPGPPPLMHPMMPPRRFAPPPHGMVPHNKMRQLKNKIQQKIKKKKTIPNPINLSSPWVTAEITEAFADKDKFYLAAKASSKTEDWDKFKEQRSKCEKMYKAAKMEYIGKHPEEMISEEETSDEDYLEVDYAEDWASRENYDYVENSEEYEWNGEETYYQDEHSYHETYQSCDNNQEASAHFCDACERGFRSENEFKIHMSEHRVCGIDGCTFVGHSKIVEKHISMQHVTGLYYRIAKTDNPEDIAKWVAERKKRYPTKENIEIRQLKQEEMMKRGERIQKPKDRFGRNERKDRKEERKEAVRQLREKKKNQYANKRKKIMLLQKPLETLSNEKLHWKGDLAPFEGTSELYEEEETKKIEDVFDDDEWMNDQSEKAPKIEISNALGALIGAYRSDDDSDEEICVKKVEILPEVEDNQQKVESRTEKQENVPDIKINSLPEQEIIETEQSEEPEEQKIVKEENKNYYQKENKEHSRNRKRKHKNSQSNVARNMSEKTSITGSKNPLQNQKIFPKKNTLLEKLLEPEIRHERNFILQCVRYVVKNNFFEQNVA